VSVAFDPLRVLFFCEHLTETGTARDQGEWNAHWFVKALKRDSMATLRQPVRLSIAGQRQELTAANAEHVVSWFGELVRHEAEEGIIPFALIEREVFFVPVPSSAATRGARTAGRTRELAEAAAEAWPVAAEVFDALRWTEQISPARGGGSRDPEYLHERLQVVRRVPAGPFILVDDVLTTGGHLQACDAALGDGDRAVFAITAARAVHSADRSTGPSWQARITTLDRFVPLQF
jgi:hypothetical protein